jgi:ubiquinone/menaquinone biosynthesis C-methylase UbiE
MNINELQRNWDQFGKNDPLWGILTLPDKMGNKWDPREFFETGKREIESLITYLDSKNLNVRKTKALDFGCGVGRLSQPLSIYFDIVNGVDIAPSMIELANQYNKYTDKCTYFVNDKDDLSLFSDNTFDFIYSNIVLQHMDPVYAKKYIREFLRVLKPKGVLIFQIPSEKKVNLANRSFIGKVKYWIKSLRIGKPMHASYPVQFGQDQTVVMEMNAIDKSEMVAFLKEIQFELIDVKLDFSTGSNWISYRYCVRKG